MSVAEIVAVVMAILVGIGLILTWVRNGNSQSEQFGSLKTDVKNIQNSLDNSDCGLGALSGKIAEFKTHCAKVSTSLSERVQSHEKSIDRLKERK